MGGSARHHAVVTGAGTATGSTGSPRRGVSSETPPSFDSFSSTHLFYSAGVGIRFRTPVLTLGVDVAQPINSPGAGPRLHINFSPKL